MKNKNVACAVIVQPRKGALRFLCQNPLGYPCDYLNPRLVEEYGQYDCIYHKDYSDIIGVPAKLCMNDEARDEAARQAIGHLDKLLR